MTDLPPKETRDDGRPGPLRLTGRWTINEAEERRIELLAELLRSGRLVLDTGGIEAIDVVGLQLLVALRTSTDRAGGSLCFATPPEGVLLAALRTAGFRDGFWTR